MELAEIPLLSCNISLFLSVRGLLARQGNDVMVYGLIVEDDVHH